ncbi:hypothetical protein EPUL_006364 [Erysiphe pulchra]|uniref:Uncharacterized protein n=1 Tax=Erysiphe pulchra TaxID=225359 RepID=A0A2S4PJD9_9PEZI|nr:hypothetical protein EPUL_006364 [Erysiphe pulchra]
MGVEERFPVKAERQRSNIRTNPYISLATFIAILPMKLEKVLMNNSTNKGVFYHCKTCGNPQARHTTENFFEDPKNKEAKASLKRRNKKKWVDYKKKKTTIESSDRSKSDYLKRGTSDDDEPSSFAGVAIDAKSSFWISDSIILTSSFDSKLVSLIDSTRWIFDTGADRYICKDLDSFDTYLAQDSVTSCCPGIIPALAFLCLYNNSLSDAA